VSAFALLPLVAVVMGLGVGSQLLADRLEVPSIIFLSLAGLLIGPAGFGLLSPTTFGESISGIVGVGVAIIVFEGAFHLDFRTLQEAPSEVVRLITIGAMISFVGTACTVHFLLAAPWDTSLLIGSLLVATGPTVITPILDTVDVRDHVAAALETEGIVNDVTAAILAVVTFKLLVLERATPLELFRSFSTRLGAGILVGLLVAGIIWYLLRHTSHSTDKAPQHAQMLVLTGAVIAFASANVLTGEAGIAAVATEGLLLGNAEIPYRDEIASFKNDVTLLVLSFIFIMLTGLLRINDLLALGLGGVATVLVIGVVLRPIGVLLSTIGNRFTLHERLFMSAVGPRGIIPASVATLFALELQQTDPRSATLLVGTVFLVIFSTVMIEGGFARHIAHLLEVIPMRVLVIGGGRVGQTLAERLEERGENVSIIDIDEQAVEAARTAGFRVHRGDATDTEVLREAGADHAKIIAAATSDDDVNLLVSQLAKTNFGVEQVIARTNNPANVNAFEELGVRAISAGLSVAWAMDNAIERPAISNWMTELEDSGDVQEVEVTAERVIGTSIREISREIPEGCLIALVSRNNETWVPDGSFELAFGDHLTILGQKDAVKTAIEQLHPDSPV